MSAEVCGDSSTQMQAYASRTLDFLNAIEKTLGSLETDAELLGVLTREASKTLDRVCVAEPGAPMDPEGRVCELLEKSAASAQRMYDDLIRRRNFARADKNLTAHDGVVEAFTKVIAATADFHNVIEDLRDAIQTVDASLEPGSGQVHTSVEDLFASLMAK